MPTFLFDRNQNKFIYIIKAFLLSYIITIPVIMFAYYLLEPEVTPVLEQDIRSYISVVIVAPIIETLVMMAIFKLLQLFSLSLVQTALLSALICAVLHSLKMPIWGVGVFVLFFILSISYLVWRKESLKSAYWVTVGIHALNNLVIMIL